MRTGGHRYTDRQTERGKDRPDHSRLDKTRPHRPTQRGTVRERERKKQAYMQTEKKTKS